MKLKQQVKDFRVRELLVEGLIRPEGAHRVYRVTKSKLSTPDAVRVLAEEARVDPGQVGIAGLKDRQGLTVQHMSVPGGRDVHVEKRNLRIAPVGFAEDALSSAASEGNAFEITVRALEAPELAVLRQNLPVVREHGLPNYFDDQRFGNLRHGQGWIARDLMLGETERALRTFLTARSPFDDAANRALKADLARVWGDWRACHEVAGRHGMHHSVFEHLAREGEDFAGAFRYVASRLRTIHLFAWQSHLWNRAVADAMREAVPLPERIVLECSEGPLVCAAGALPEEIARWSSFPLPGPGLDDVRDPRQHELLRDALAKEGMVPDQFRIAGVPGFGLKGEERALVLRPRHLRVRPPQGDPLNRGQAMVRLRFELPRGSYATLVVKRLMARPLSGLREDQRGAFARGDRREVGRGHDFRHDTWRERQVAGRGERGDRPRRDDRDLRDSGGGRSARGSRYDRRDDRQGERRDDRSGDRGRGRPFDRGHGRGDDRGRSGRPDRGSRDQRGAGRREGGRDDRGGPRRGHWSDRRDDRRDDRRHDYRDDRRDDRRHDHRGDRRFDGRVEGGGRGRDDRGGDRRDFRREGGRDDRWKGRGGSDRGGRPGGHGGGRTGGRSGGRSGGGSGGGYGGRSRDDRDGGRRGGGDGERGGRSDRGPWKGGGPRGGSRGPGRREGGRDDRGGQRGRRGPGGGGRDRSR